MKDELFKEQEGENKMPCSKYKGKQKRLCYLTDEWEDFTKVKKYRNRYKRNFKRKVKGGNLI